MVLLTDVFHLILAALTLIIICLFVIVVFMIRDGGKSKAKTSSATKGKTAHKCLHFVGYLADEHPREKPIPEECFGCTLAMECINKQVKKKKIVAPQVARVPSKSRKKP